MEKIYILKKCIERRIINKLGKNYQWNQSQLISDVNHGRQMASKNCCYRENKNATRATKNITLEMNKFTENGCQPNFELKF